jgi:hypothetical protein
MNKVTVDGQYSPESLSSALKLGAVEELDARLEMSVSHCFGNSECGTD